MSTKTTTAVTHYHIQKKRRAEFIEECKKGGWRNFPQFKNQGQCVSFVAWREAQAGRAERDIPTVESPLRDRSISVRDRRCWSRIEYALAAQEFLEFLA